MSTHRTEKRLWMSVFCLFLISLSLSACAAQPISGHSDKHAKSYLSLDLPYAPFEKMRQEVERSEQLQLLHRGEAHITVLTPPEFNQMKKRLNMKEIEILADKMNLQKSAYDSYCIGKGISQGDRTYFVVIQSEDLFKIRKAIHALYVSKGGDTKDFNPELYHPHVTLGFTKRDLHLQDGVTKDASSCIRLLRH